MSNVREPLSKLNFQMIPTGHCDWSVQVTVMRPAEYEPCTGAVAPAQSLFLHSPTTVPSPSGLSNMPSQKFEKSIHNGALMLSAFTEPATSAVIPRRVAILFITWLPIVTCYG